MLNKVILMGRLCADPDFRQTQSGVAVCRIRVAVDRRFSNKQTGEREADFISVTCWRQQAEFVSRYFHKGSMIIVEGSLRNSDYTDQNGVKHYSMDVQADNVSFGESSVPHRKTAADTRALISSLLMHKQRLHSLPRHTSSLHPRQHRLPRHRHPTMLPALYSWATWATSKRSSATAKFPSDQANENTALQIGG